VRKPSQAELDQLLAPIALYPDSLLGQILMASTYPLEVVEADRWRQNPRNAALAGDGLAAAVEEQSWDPSVKSLVQFPRILRMMDLNLEWTEQLGEAFLSSQASVVDSVQRLRHRATTAGTFRSNAERAGVTGSSTIVIAPPNPDIVEVPVYNPANAYGAWPDPLYPPDYFPAAFDGVALDDFGFGWIGIPILAPLWGWDTCDWGRHRIAINPGRWAALAGNPPPSGDVWEHSPLHRRGVPYHVASLRAEFPRAASLPQPRYRSDLRETRPGGIGQNTGAQIVRPNSGGPSSGAPQIIRPRISQSLSPQPQIVRPVQRAPVAAHPAPPPRPVMMQVEHSAPARAAAPAGHPSPGGR
jgi:hypothetical protein